MGKLYYSLKFRLLFLITLLILTFGTLAAIFVFYTSYNVLTKQESEILSVITKGKAEKVLQRLNTTSHVLTNISENKLVKEYLLTEEEKKLLDVQKILEEQIIDDRYLAIYILNIDGIAVASTDPRFMKQNYSFRTYFKDAIKTGWGNESAVGVTSGDLGIYFSRLISNGANGKMGVVVVKIDPQNLRSLVSVTNDARINYFFTDICGTVLFTNKTGLNYSNLTSLTDTEISDCRFKERFPGKEQRSLGYGEVLKNINNYKNSGIVEIKNNYSGEEKIVAFEAFEGYPFLLVFDIGKNELFSNAMDLSRTVTYFVLAAALFALLLLIIFVRKILDPITSIKHAANEISKGNFSIHLKEDSKDEFGELSALINKMSRELKELYQNCEKKVLEKTQELETVNKYLTGRELKVIELKKRISDLENRK